MSDLKGAAGDAETSRRGVSLTDEVRRSAGALSAEIDGEVVALNVARGMCYGLDQIGARIWVLIKSPILVGRLCAILCAEYDVDLGTCHSDVLDLLEELLAEDLISVTSTPSWDP